MIENHTCGYGNLQTTPPRGPEPSGPEDQPPQNAPDS